ncbi:hypothetical protein JX266_011362 [Neoarthrinium moseri]|nr:hypothetical protein JX266_011362 [Neoarthrinium moseri]
MHWTTQPSSNTRSRTSLRARDAWKSQSTDDQVQEARANEGKPRPLAIQRTHQGRPVVHAPLNLSTVPRRANVAALLKPMSLAGFERLIADTGLKELDLDALIGVATGQTYGLPPREQLARLSKPKQVQSFLTYIPTRYGHRTCLDDVIRCLTSKIKSMLVPTALGEVTDTLSLYGKALKSVQAAIQSASWADPDVLCAIAMLGTYEALEGSNRTSAWTHHTFGLSQLIAARGPSRFTTRFEKLILSSTSCWLIYESLHSGLPCVLGEPSWEPVFQSMARPEFPEVDQTFAWLGSLGVKVSRLIVEMHDATCDDYTVSESGMKDLESRCRNLKLELMRWKQESQAIIEAPRRPEGTPAMQGDLRAELTSAAYAMLAATCRLVGAISPEDRTTEEREAISISDYLSRVGDSMKWDKIASFYFQQRINVTKSIILTSDIWLQGCDDANVINTDYNGRLEGKRRLIESYKFQAWRDCMRRSLSYQPGSGHR